MVPCSAPSYNSGHPKLQSLEPPLLDNEVRWFQIMRGTHNFQTLRADTTQQTVTVSDRPSSMRYPAITPLEKIWKLALTRTPDPIRGGGYLQGSISAQRPSEVVWLLDHSVQFARWQHLQSAAWLDLARLALLVWICVAIYLFNTYTHTHKTLFTV